MFTMFVLTRMAIRAGVLVALVATIVSIGGEFVGSDEWDTVQAHAADLLHWLRDLFSRIGRDDPSLGDITLADLASPSGWVDLGQGLFGGAPAVEMIDAPDTVAIGDLGVVSPQSLAGEAGLAADG